MAVSLPGILLCWILGNEPLTFYIALWTLPFFSALIGLLDDFLKLSRRSSEGLKSLEKLILQIFVALLWSALVFRIGYLDLFPNLNLSPLWTVFVTSFIIVSMLNAVNVTDGLDGLAAGTFSLSLVALAFLVSRGLEVIPVGLGLSVAFLWHNAYPARVFMGDCGSHFLGGLLVAIAACGGGVLYVIPVGALFGLEILSVAIQIVSIRCFGKKFFLMSPVHHHFELLGWSEVQIVLRFWLLHLLGIVSMLWLRSFVPSIF